MCWLTFTPSELIQVKLLFVRRAAPHRAVAYFSAGSLPELSLVLGRRSKTLRLEIEFSALETCQEMARGRSASLSIIGFLLRFLTSCPLSTQRPFPSVPSQPGRRYSVIKMSCRRESTSCLSLGVREPSGRSPHNC